MGARFVLKCAERGCVSEHAAGDPQPELCPVCRNPLHAGAVQPIAPGATPPATPKPKRARSSRAPGLSSSAKAPAASYGGTDR
jgi:hypothetical protein